MLVVPKKRNATLIVNLHERRVGSNSPTAPLSSAGFCAMRRHPDIVLSEHEIQYALTCRKAVPQRDALRQHLYALDGVARQVGQFYLSREVSIDERPRPLITASAARERAQRIDKLTNRV